MEKYKRYALKEEVRREATSAADQSWRVMRFRKCRLTRLCFISVILAHIFIFCVIRIFYFEIWALTPREYNCPVLVYPASLGGPSATTHVPKFTTGTVPNNDDVFWNISYETRAVIFSAFEIVKELSSGEILIRVLGADVTDNRVALYCQLWDHHAPVRVVSAIETTQSSSSGNTHVPVRIECIVPPGKQVTAVSIVTKPCERPQNLLQVHRQGKPPWKKNFTICYAPIQFNYDQAVELIESVERNRVFGADFFIFYNISHSSDVGRVIEYYVRKGLGEVVQWQIPLHSEGSESQIHYGGQTVAMNDCLYRYAYFTKYTVFTDIDEVIFPAKHDQWQSLIDELVSSDKSIKTFAFRNVMFWKDPDSWKRDVVSDKILSFAKEWNIISLQNFYRSKVYRISDRSKVIVDPRFVDTMEIHYVNKWRSGATNLDVPSTDGRLHHYRTFEIEVSENQRLFDYSMMTYADEIISRFKTTYNEIFV